MNARWAWSRPMRWKERPRCQSEVCSILKKLLRPARFPLLHLLEPARPGTGPPSAPTTLTPGSTRTIIYHGEQVAHAPQPRSRCPARALRAEVRRDGGSPPSRTLPVRQ
ncbi:hypothetical protein GCM10010319_36840 [Streptomyces blastmyceticus]|uniref:Uncharacterized protein n=1 Tax=Streptomyces blastmyceticus TaxID=68180 RepID=A0ABN0X6B0_9ACTN